MAFLPALTEGKSGQNGKGGNKNRRNDNKKAGYRVSLANINKTSKLNSGNVTPRSSSDGNNESTVVRSVRNFLPPLEDIKTTFETRSSYDDEEEKNRKKSLKLPKCPSPFSAKKTMFWLEALGLWVPMKQGRRLYETFSRRLELLCKDPDCLMDPCPHIPRCDHSRSWSAVRLERQKFRELRELRNEQLLQKTLERYQNMQEFWMEQLNNRAELAHMTPAQVRLQNFRKSRGKMEPLSDAQRHERLQGRQREWEEAWKLACEKREKVWREAECRKKNPRRMLPKIIVTDYEFVMARDERVDINNESCDVYFEERYHVVCTPVQSASPCERNRRTLPGPKCLPGITSREPKICDPYTGSDPSRIVSGKFGVSESSARRQTITVPCEPYRGLKPTCTWPGEVTLGHKDHLPRGDNAAINKCDVERSDSNIMQDSPLLASYTSSGTSLDTVVTTGTSMDIMQSTVSLADIYLAEGIKQADSTVRLMSRLVPAPLGVSSGKIPDQQITASSVLDIYHTAGQARLHNEKQETQGGAWLPRQHDVNPYLQVDLGHVTTVQQVATQGNASSAVKSERHRRWVTKFGLEFSQDGVNWEPYQEAGQLKIFTGNSDLDSVVLNSLENAVETRYIRFRPKEWHNGIAMRVEVLGLNPLSETVEDAAHVRTPPQVLEKEEKVDENRDVEKVFQEIKRTNEGVTFGLSVEGRAVTPWTPHSPVPSLISPDEQDVKMDDECLQSSIHRQNLQEFKRRTPSSFSSISRESETISNSSSPEIISDEPHSTPKDDPEDNEDAKVETELKQGSPTVDEVPVVTSSNDSPDSLATSPLPSPPEESWAQALERARANGSIKRELMREKMAEERRRKLAMLASKRRKQYGEHASANTEDLDELGSFLERYCIIAKSDLDIYSDIFAKFDEDQDGFLWPEEVLEALENVNSKLLTDSHLSYVFRVLEQCECQAEIGIGFRLFSIIAAMSQRVASLNDKMKKLIAKCDFKTIDYTLERVKMLFECYVNENTMRISRTDLWIGLAAGGLRKAEETIDDYFSEKLSFDFLDFLTYLPLFQEIHGHVVENPLTLF